MRLHRLRYYREFAVHESRETAALEEHLALAASLIPTDVESWTVKGYSYTAGSEQLFLADVQHSGGTGDVNWRERLCCPVTGFNNRQRAAIHLFDLETEPHRDSSIHQRTEHASVQLVFRALSGCDRQRYLGDAVPYGTADSRSVRNETLCDLQFARDSFEIIVSLDVFQYIADFRLAFRECHRVLKNGGRMLWSVPFAKHSEKNIVRASVDNHCGWEMLDDVRAAGFKDAYAIFFYSSRFGYLGGDQVMFVSRT